MKAMTAMLGRTRRRLQAWRLLSGRERALILWLMCLLPFVGLRIRIQGLAPVLKRRRTITSALWIDPQRLADLITLAGTQGLVRSTCLPQSVVLLNVLQRHGVTAQLRMGAAPRGGSLAAHAWVELDGIVLGREATHARSFGPLEPSAAP